jgi:hypothetical protein
MLVKIFAWNRSQKCGVCETIEDPPEGVRRCFQIFEACFRDGVDVKAIRNGDVIDIDVPAHARDDYEAMLDLECGDDAF